MAVPGDVNILTVSMPFGNIGLGITQEGNTMCVLLFFT
jgi:hypothetical protein